MKTKAEKYFKENPNVPEVYYTSDGFPFLNPYFAKQHANTLDDTQVQTFQNESLGVAAITEDTDVDTGLTADELELITKGLDNKNYNALLALAKKLQLNISDNKAKTVIDALQAWAELNVK